MNFSAWKRTAIPPANGECRGFQSFENDWDKLKEYMRKDFNLELKNYRLKKTVLNNSFIDSIFSRYILLIRKKLTQSIQFLNSYTETNLKL